MTETSGSPAAEGPSPKGWQRLPKWAKWTIGIVGAILLMGIGAAIAGGNNEDKLKDEVASLETDLSRAEVEAEAAEDKNDELEAEQEEVIADAEVEAEKLVSDARQEAGRLNGALLGAKQELKSAEGQLSDVRGEIGSEKERVAKSKISDGVWQLEVDFVSGTYEAPGGNFCYWEKLSSAGGEFEDIIENENGTGRQLLTIDSPYFHTEGCGTWELIE